MPRDFIDEAVYINVGVCLVGVSPAGRKHQQLQHQIEQLQEELDRSDAGQLLSLSFYSYECRLYVKLY